MPLPLIPILVGVGSTAAVGWWWSSSSQEDKPSVSGEIWNTIQPFVLILLVILLLRWIWKKGTPEKGKNSS